MSEIKSITKTLKRCLKERGVTYGQLAEQLQLSEASIKRCFSLNAFTLERLEAICQCLQMSLSDLFELERRQKSRLSQLSEEQERELLSDPKLLLAAVCVRDGWQFEELIQHYDIDYFEGVRLMARLDKLRLIELLPDNRYKLLIAQDFRWIPGGPLEKFMEQEVMIKFMAPKRNEPWTFRFYLRGRYSQSSINIIQRRLNQLTKEAATLNEDDMALPVSERTHMGLLMAMRPWEPSLFENMRRQAHPTTP
ncbi:XRE family transcriptional regulator [Alteromonas aestuariivivens]|uniref:XRE family transcriptional regulator n=1 Tax=Alteromonas aestuariivivens TaxID=1938339 RepID=A0A3D8MCY3_9ALTE|nr:helix-turn-helix transcriptional regulator [Alteromonas aestuariivivens]RDV28100.1 XRE family transcriptional regulator [Alteromonas aestuariivivens]